MNIKISNWAIFAILVGVGILTFALFRGCQAAKNSKDNISSLKASNDSLKTLNKETKEQWALSDKAHADSLEFERGQRTLAENQYERTSLELDKERAINKKLIEKYKYHQYADTGMVMTPSEFVNDCKDCFTQLERTDNLTFKLRKEVSDWNQKYNWETKLLEDRVKQIKNERDGYYNKVDSLTKIQSKSIAQIKPTGRLYFSWGVLWSPLPIAAGGGIMYQTPRNIIFGLKGYYGVTKSMSNKTTIETTINFPLSFKIK